MVKKKINDERIHPLARKFLCGEEFKICKKYIQTSNTSEFASFIDKNYTILGEQNSKGNSLLHIAVYCRQLAIVEKIIAISNKHNFILEAENSKQDSPFDIAVEMIDSKSTHKAVERQILNIIAAEHIDSSITGCAEKLAKVIVEKLYHVNNNSDRDTAYTNRIAPIFSEFLKHIYTEFVLRKYSAENFMFLEFLDNKAIEFFTSEKIIDIFKSNSHYSTYGFGVITQRLSLSDKEAENVQNALKNNETLNIAFENFLKAKIFDHDCLMKYNTTFSDNISKSEYEEPISDYPSSESSDELVCLGEAAI